MSAKPSMLDIQSFEPQTHIVWVAAWKIFCFFSLICDDDSTHSHILEWAQIASHTMFALD
jgi:hypothetical protein